MGQRSHQKRRDAAIAAVKAGTISASDAYRTMDGAGSLTDGLLEPYEAEAKVFGNGIWKNLNGTQKTNALNSMSELQAKAETNAPKTEAEKKAERDRLIGSESASRPVGYNLMGDPAGNSAESEVKSLIEERQVLTDLANKYGGAVAKKNVIRIEEINDRINKLNDPSYQRTITPDEAAAWTKFTEGTTNDSWSAPTPTFTESRWTDDPAAQAKYAREYQEQIAQGAAPTVANRIATMRVEQWIDSPFRFITDPLDKIILGDPTGIAGQVAANGVGVGVGLGPGNPANSGSPPNVDAQVNNFVNDARAVNPGMGNISAPGVDPNGPNAGGSTLTPGYNQAMGQAPTDPYFTPATGTTTNPTLTNPTGTNASNLPASLNQPGTVLAGNPAAPVPPGNTQTTGTPPGTTSTNNTGPGAQTGGTPPGTPPPPDTGGGNWWEQPGAKEALAAAGIIVGAGGSLIAAKTAADGQIGAAEIQRKAAQDAINAQRGMYNQTRLDQEPWRQAGSNALTELSNFNQTNPEFQFNTSGNNIDPSYSWRLSEGIKALENAASARGTLKSGNTLKAITEYGQGAASQEYGNAFNRYTTQRQTNLNRLQSLANVGQTAVNATGQAGQNYTNNATNALIGGAQAMGQGQTGAANAWAQGGMGAANAVINGLSEYYQNQQRQGILNSLKF